MLRNLKLSNFRNYQHAEIEFDSRNVILTGRNGQGKSNLLEAIFFLSVLRSFRTSKTGDLRRIGSSSFYVGADVRKKNWNELIEVSYGEGGKRRLSIDKQPVFKGSEFINRIRAVVFSPEDINIVTANSGLRRRFMDMLISLIEPQYLNALKDYNDALKNRNALLRVVTYDPGAFDAYEEIMAVNSFKIIAERQKYTAVLVNEVGELLRELENPGVFNIRYREELKDLSAEFFKQRLINDRQRDLKRGFTGFGPHSDDFELFFGQKAMRAFASTGQCRLISLCLKMAKLNIVCEHNNSDLENVIVLVDDVTGELDERMRTMFFKVISRAGQAFFTFTESPDFNFSGDCGLYNISDQKIVKI
ncbi:MAG: DNA replication and repair protein RecF [Victivallales bacterium]|nr:DNA replication and repair protein RecF [Victivallales bacterium]